MSERVVVTCTHCGGLVRLPSNQSGDVDCPHCRGLFQADTRAPQSTPQELDAEFTNEPSAFDIQERNAKERKRVTLWSLIFGAASFLSSSAFIYINITHADVDNLRQIETAAHNPKFNLILILFLAGPGALFGAIFAELYNKYLQYKMKNRRTSSRIKLLTLICATLSLGNSGAAQAGAQAVMESSIYFLGDNDSRSDARAICANAAKRSAVEKVGSLIFSEFEFTQRETNAKFEADATKRTRSYLSAVVSSESAGEQWAINNGQLTLTCRVRVSFDPEEVRNKLALIGRDDTLRVQLDAQRSQIEQLEKRLADLNSSLSRPNEAERSFSDRQQRVNVIGELSSAEGARNQAVAAMKSAEERATQIEPGMLEREVVAIAGTPRFQVTDPRRNIKQEKVLNYGKIWITLRHGAVVLVEKEDEALAAFTGEKRRITLKK